MNTEVERLAAEVREQNALYEAGDTDKAFWLGQQKRLARMEAAGASRAEIGRLVGKTHPWVKLVLEWNVSRHTSPFARDARAATGHHPDDSTAKKVARERPEKIAAAIEAAPPEAQEKIAKALAPTRAGAKITDAHDEHLRSRSPGERTRMTPRPGESTSDQLGKLLEKAKFSLARVYELLGERPVDDDLRSWMLTMLHQTEDLCRRNRGLLVGDEEFNRELAEAGLAGGETNA